MKKVILLVLICVSFGAFAQTSNFSGTWLINKTKTEWANVPVWTQPFRFEVTQSGDKLTINRRAFDEQGNELKPLKDEMSFGGTASETTTSTGLTRRTTIVRNADKETFTLIANSIAPDGQSGLKATEVWTLADGGKTLIIDRTIEQANGLKYSIKLFYDKSN